MMFGSYRTVYGGQMRAVPVGGGVKFVRNPWLLEPGVSMAHRLKLVPQKVPAKVRPAGQAASPSPWLVLGIVGAGLAAVTALQYAMHKAR